MIVDYSSEEQLNRCLEEIQVFYELDCASSEVPGFNESILRLQRFCANTDINELINAIESLDYNPGKSGCTMLCVANYIVQAIEDKANKVSFINALNNLKLEKSSNPVVQNIFNYAIGNCNLVL